MSTAADLELAWPTSRRGAPTDGPRICQLVHGLPIGGAEVIVDRLVRRLGDEFPMAVACLDEVGQLGEALVAAGVPVVRLGRRPGFDWKCTRKLQRRLRDQDIRLIHAHQCTPLAYALATQAFGPRPPVLLTEHGRFFPDLPSRKRKLFHRLAARASDRFVAVGEAVRQALVANEGLPANRIDVIYNGVEPPAKSLLASERANSAPS